MSYKDSFWNKDIVQDMYELDNAEEVTLQPYIANIIHSFNPTTLLDYGCGYGYMSKLLNKNIDISLFDKNKDNQARLTQSITGSNIKVIKQESEILKKYYECVVLSSVLMCIDSKSKIKTILTKLNNAKTKNGKLIIVVTHPCFLQYKFGHYYTSYNHYNFEYMEEGKPYQVFMLRENEEPVTFTDYQWTLSTFINSALGIGLELEKIIEHPDMPYKTNKYHKTACPWMFLILK